MRRPAILLAMTAAALVGCAPPKPQLPPPGPAVVSVANPVEVPFAESVVFTGRTEPSQWVEIRPRVSGYLNKVCFRPGTMVKAGDVLFEIDNRPYVQALQQAQGQKEQLEARIKRLLAEEHRARNLLEKSAIGQQDYDKAVADRAEASASVAISSAALDRAKLDLEWTKVVSPCTGLVGKDLINVGNLAAADQTKLTTVAAVDPMFVTFDMDENTVLKILRLIREGQFMSARENRVPVQLALGDSTGFPFDGYVNFVDNRVDPTTGTMRIRATLPNPQLSTGAPRIAAGLFARVRFDLGKPHPTLMIAERAILSDQAQKFVYVVGEKNLAERRDVQVGAVEGARRTVLKGLKKTDLVVVNGVQRVRTGAAVDPKTVAMPGGDDTPAPAKK